MNIFVGNKSRLIALIHITLRECDDSVFVRQITAQWQISGKHICCCSSLQN